MGVEKTDRRLYVSATPADYDAAMTSAFRCLSLAVLVAVAAGCGEPSLSGRACSIPIRVENAYSFCFSEACI